MNSQTITREQLCKLFDHTNLKAFADKEMFETLCKEAADGHFAMVAINSSPVALCKRLLKDTDVQTTTAVKVFEAEDAIANGADEIDYVINVGEAKMGNWQYIRSEMEAMVAACRKGGALCKVIFEICYLTMDEIRAIAKIARDVRPDFIKTSTGFGTSGATVEAVKLMKDTVGDAVKVKAAGGIRDWETCAAMIDAGAERIGTSSSLKILAEFDAAHK